MEYIKLYPKVDILTIAKRNGYQGNKINAAIQFIFAKTVRMDRDMACPEEYNDDEIDQIEEDLLAALHDRQLSEDDKLFIRAKAMILANAECEIDALINSRPALVNYVFEGQVLSLEAAKKGLDKIFNIFIQRPEFNIEVNRTTELFYGPEFSSVVNPNSPELRELVLTFFPNIFLDTDAFIKCMEKYLTSNFITQEEFESLCLDKIDANQMYNDHETILMKLIRNPQAISNWPLLVLATNNARFININGANALGYMLVYGTHDMLTQAYIDDLIPDGASFAQYLLECASDADIAIAKQFAYNTNPRKFFKNMNYLITDVDLPTEYILKLMPPQFEDLALAGYTLLGTALVYRKDDSRLIHYLYRDETNPVWPQALNFAIQNGSTHPLLSA